MIPWLSDNAFISIHVVLYISHQLMIVGASLRLVTVLIGTTRPFPSTQITIRSNGDVRVVFRLDAYLWWPVAASHTVQTGIRLPGRLLFTNLHKWLISALFHLYVLHARVCAVGTNTLGVLRMLDTRWYWFSIVRWTKHLTQSIDSVGMCGGGWE
jgi:hypothetical protein